MVMSQFKPDDRNRENIGILQRSVRRSNPCETTHLNVADFLAGECKRMLSMFFLSSALCFIRLIKIVSKNGHRHRSKGKRGYNKCIPYDSTCVVSKISSTTKNEVVFPLYLPPRLLSAEAYRGFHSVEYSP